MKETVATPCQSPVSCKICGMSSLFFERAQVLRKYRVQYFRCQHCGFIQTEEPYWLEEAYTTAIAMQDVGIMPVSYTHLTLPTNREV